MIVRMPNLSRWNWISAHLESSFLLLVLALVFGWVLSTDTQLLNWCSASADIAFEMCDIPLLGKIHQALAKRIVTRVEIPLSLSKENPYHLVAPSYYPFFIVLNLGVLAHSVVWYCHLFTSFSWQHSAIFRTLDVAFVFLNATQEYALRVSFALNLAGPQIRQSLRDFGDYVQFNLLLWADGTVEGRSVAEGLAERESRRLEINQHMSDLLVLHLKRADRVLEAAIDAMSDATDPAERLLLQKGLMKLTQIQKRLEARNINMQRLQESSSKILSEERADLAWEFSWLNFVQDGAWAQLVGHVRSQEVLRFLWTTIGTLPCELRFGTMQRGAVEGFGITPSGFLLASILLLSLALGVLVLGWTTSRGVGMSRSTWHDERVGLYLFLCSETLPYVPLLITLIYGLMPMAPG